MQKNRFFEQFGGTLASSVLKITAIALFGFAVWATYTYFSERVRVNNTVYDVSFRAKGIMTSLETVPLGGYKMPNYSETTEYDYPVEIYGIREQYNIANGFVIDVLDLPLPICKKILDVDMKDVVFRMVNGVKYTGNREMCTENTKKVSFVYTLPEVDVRMVRPGAVRTLNCKLDRDCGQCSKCENGICSDELFRRKKAGQCCTEDNGRYCCPLTPGDCDCKPEACCASGMCK